jgi:hypothetical protein
MRVPALMTVAAGLALALAACSAASPTPIIIHVTPSPSPTTSATPIAISVATPTPTAQPTDTLAAPTPTVPAAPTDVPTAAPTGPAGGCSGSQANKDWWAAESKHLVFTVYCGSMPSGWYFETANDNYNNGGMMYAEYKGPSGATFSVFEGKFDPTIHGPSLGSANFGDLGGTLTRRSRAGRSRRLRSSTWRRAWCRSPSLDGIGPSPSGRWFVSCAAARESGCTSKARRARSRVGAPTTTPEGEDDD